MRNPITYSRILATAILIVIATLGAAAQVSDEVAEVSEALDSRDYNKWTRSRDFVDGNRAIDTQDYENAVTLLEKEIKTHPANGYAMCNLAWCKNLWTAARLNEKIMELLNESGDMEEAQHKYETIYRSAVTDFADYAKLMRQGIAKLPAPDVETQCKAHIKLQSLLENAEADTTEQIAALKHAIEVHPCYESYLAIMGLYSKLEDTANAAEWAIKAGDILEGDPDATRLKAIAYQYRKDYDRALPLINQLLTDDETDVDMLKARCEIHTDQGNYKEALDDYTRLLEAQETKGKFEPFRLLDHIAHISDNAHDAVIDYVHRQQIAQAQEEDGDSEGNINWNIVEAMLHYNHYDYSKSLECFERGSATTQNADLAGIIASNFFMLGRVDEALTLCDGAQLMQSVDKQKQEKEDDDEDSSEETNFLTKRIMMEMSCGMVEEAIHDAQVGCIAYADDPATLSTYHSILAWAHIAKGQYQKAIENYDRWIETGYSTSSARYSRARAMMMAGMTADASDELNQLLSTEDFDGNQELKMNTLYYLGRKTEARDLLDKLAANTDSVQAMSREEIERATTLPETMDTYNLACFYSLMGDTDKALDYLRSTYEGSGEEALNFNYAVIDSDFDNIRQDPRFMSIINEFKTRWLNGQYRPKKK
jgi:tetratricopeptide (TPR) repeat protein